MSHKDELSSPPLRLIKTPALKPKYEEPSPKVKAMIEDMQRQQTEQKRRCELCDPGGKDVA